ncbi:PH domain-containing protein [Halovenus sp. HT40]|uniref:PH domain-containing protein n=1 Tax=Halovenus sp. HT40 TaxID=3126691 RepID=UPI00300F1CD1
MSRDDQTQQSDHQRSRDDQGQRQQSQTAQHTQQPRTAQQSNPPQQASVSLLDGEEVLIDARPAWSAYSLQLIVAGLIIIGGFVAGNEAVIGGLLVGGVIVGYVFYQRRKLRYVVTDRRMMKVIGLSSKTTSEAWMVDIRGLQTGASLIERLLGHGHITVSADILSTGIGRFQGMTFGGISNYEQIAQIIRERQNASKMD